VGDCMVRLLNSGDATTFADAVAPRFSDWQAIGSTNLITKGEDPVAEFQKQSERIRKEIESSARQALEQATALGVGGTRVKYRLKSAQVKFVGSTRYSTLQPEGEELKWVPEVKVTLIGEALDTSATKLNGEYSLSLGGQSGGLRFPSGWRFNGGIRWQSFPAGVADDKTSLQMTLFNKASSDHKLSLADDPALAITGNSLIKFLQTRDEGILTNDLMKSMDEIWAGNQKYAANTGRPLPPREEFEKGMLPFRLETIQSAREMLTQLDQAGVTLSNATVRLKDALADSMYPKGTGLTENLDCGKINFAFEVTAGNATPAGKPITGVYVVASGHTIRSEKRWTFMSRLRWQSMPETVLGEKDKAELEFENYVAEKRALPPGTRIPAVELVSITDGKKLKLSELKQEATILEFWATWCGPCQEPMKKLQAAHAKHPEWKGRVAIVTASIDDNADLPRKHLDKRGWTNSVATWVGEGDWQAATTKAFRVSGVPTCYVIDKDGKVAASGHPESIQYEQVVKRLLK